MDLVTTQDLQAFEARIQQYMDDIKEELLNAGPEQKAFYSPKEFAAKTGLTYHCVIKRCKSGRLKAHQDHPGAAWMIDASEINRLRESAKLHERLGRRGYRGKH